MGTVGDNIKKFRTFRGIKQQTLADKLHKSKSVISNWERGENSPDVEVCAQICKILDVTPNELFGWSTNKAYEQWVAYQAKLADELAYMQAQKAELERRIAECAASLAPFNDKEDDNES